MVTLLYRNVQSQQIMYINYLQLFMYSVDFNKPGKKIVSLRKKKMQVAIKEVITYRDVYTINIYIAEEIMLQVTDLILYFKQLENKPDISRKGEIITKQKSLARKQINHRTQQGSQRWFFWNSVKFLSFWPNQKQFTNTGNERSLYHSISVGLKIIGED